MNFTPYYNLIAAAIILLIVALVYIGFQIKSLSAEIQVAAYKLYFELTAKDDLLPQLVEKLSNYVDRGKFAEIIQRRHFALAKTQIGAEKKHIEEQLWESFDFLWKAVSAQTDLQKDVGLMALTKNLKEADQRIEENSKAYNSLVKKYNRLAGNFLLFPVKLLVKAKKVEAY